jgi:hypothetical protein
VSRHTEAAFSALVGLDPLAGARARPPRPGQPALRGDPADTSTDAYIARIIATPRPGATARPAGRTREWAVAPQGRRSRYGALGLAASAAVAVVTTLLWASPSAGAPPDQAVHAAAHIVQAHGSPPA